MGGTPLLALSIAAFPRSSRPRFSGDVLAGADERRSCRGRDPRWWPHRSRDRAEVRARRSLARCILRPSGPRRGRGSATPSTSPNRSDRDRVAGSPRGESVGRGTCSSRRRDARAEPRRRRRASSVRPERGHGRDRIRVARSRARAGVQERRACDRGVGRATSVADCDRARLGRRSNRGRSPQSGVRGSPRREHRGSRGRGTRLRSPDGRRPLDLASRRARGRPRGDVRSPGSLHQAYRAHRARRRSRASCSGHDGSSGSDRVGDSVPAPGFRIRGVACSSWSPRGRSCG